MSPKISTGRTFHQHLSEIAYDAVIVGAGPAGCLAAISAPESCQILLVDRLALPRDVICGGILVPSVLNMTADIPPDEKIFSRPRKFNWSLYDGSLHRSGPLTDTVYYNINRFHFDNWLYQAASTRKNVDIWPLTTFLRVSEAQDGGLNIVLSRQSREYNVGARFLIGADGARSNVRRFTKSPDTEFWTTIQCSLRSDGIKVDRMLAFLDPNIDYYGWVVPKDGDILVGLGCNRKQDPREALRAFRAMLKERHDIFGSLKGNIRSRHATRLRSWRELYPGQGNILLAGEAAGLICPWSGEGISSAIYSGGLAGSLLSHPAPLKKYRRRLMYQMPRRMFNHIGYQTMSRPWARRIMALAIPGDEFRPTGI